MNSARSGVLPVPTFGAEDVLVDRGRFEGHVLTGAEDGTILRVSRDGARVTALVNTHGRPLGLEHLPDGRLLVCDAERGLLALEPASARIEVLADEIDGRRLRLCNNAAVAADGTVYFSDSSRLHPLSEWEEDLARHTRTGRLLRRRPDGALDVLADGLAFANGVALSCDESFVVVAETGARTLVRVRLTGRDAGRRDLLADGLPGYPDNVATAPDGGFWVAIASPTEPILEALHHAPPWLRRSATRLPAALKPAPRRRLMAVRLDIEGRIVADLAEHESALLDRFHMVTGVRQHEDRLWLGSLRESAVAFVDL